MVAKANCPVFLVHGKQDNLIPVQHSIDLYKACKKEAYLHMPNDMDHNEFMLETDLVEPIKDFLHRI